MPSPPQRSRCQHEPPRFTPADAAALESGLRSTGDLDRLIVEDITYALAKQVPDITGRGCTIGTSYGAIDIPPGRTADHLAACLTRLLQCELLAATKRAAHATRQEAGHVL